MTLEEIKKLCEGATVGPWYSFRQSDKHPRSGRYVTTENDDLVAQCRDDATTRFIAAARTLLPKLLAVAEALKISLDADHDPRSRGAKWDDVLDALAALEASP